MPAAGTLKGAAGEPDRRLLFRTTVHGPVVAYATVAGRRVAVARKRSTRGRELLSALAWQDLNTNKPHNAAEFLRSASHTGLPTSGGGDFEWRGYLPFARHPQAISPASGIIVNWNNKPAPGFAAADDQWACGSVQRVELLHNGLAATPKHTLATVVSAMNAAGTQDLRTVEVWPSIRAVLDSGPAPSSRAQAAAQLVDDWRAQGSSRLDRDLDGRIDHPGAAVLEAAWRPLAESVLAPVLGPLVPRLRQVHGGHDAPGPDADGFGSGWYGYVDKDLRSLLGRPVNGPYRTRFCGAGDLVACRAALWGALDAAAGELEAAQGADPARWRADATAERIRFAGGLLPRTMRFTNRPTFQQVLTFNGHRPR